MITVPIVLGVNNMADFRFPQEVYREDYLSCVVYISFRFGDFLGLLAILRALPIRTQDTHGLEKRLRGFML